MADKISFMQFWEALEYSGNGVDYGKAKDLYKVYEYKKVETDCSVSKTIRAHAEERAVGIIEMVRQERNVAEAFRTLL